VRPCECGEAPADIRANATRVALPLRAPALSTLIAREPEMKQAGTGLGYSCLSPWGVYIETPAPEKESATPLSILKTWSDVFQVKMGLAGEHLMTDATSLPTLQPGQDGHP